MSLENILAALEADTEQLVVEIEQSTQAELERIRTQAQTEAKTVRRKHMTAIQAPLQAERARILNRAKLEALQTVMGTREALMTSAQEAAARCLAVLGVTEKYAGLLQQLTQEAVATLGADNGLCLQVQSCDVALMNHISREMGLPATVEGGLENKNPSRNCLGGIIAATPDRRVTLVNTLEARLQRVADLHRARIAKMVFDDEQEG